MDRLENPYTPNAGATPPVMVGRDDQVDTFRLLLHRLLRGRTEQSMIVTGLRGVGKTVLLGRLRQEAIHENWAVIDIEVSKHNNRDLRRQLAMQFRKALLDISPRARWKERAKRAAGVLTSFSLTIDADGNLTAGLGVPPIEGYGDTGDLGEDLVDLFLAVGEAAKENESGLVLLLDEIQFLTTTQLEAVVSALHKTVQLSLPLTLVGAGLPQIAELAGEAKSYAERLFKFPEIGRLSFEDARAALARPSLDAGIGFDDDALELAFEATDGYPYFLQELGYAVWNIAEAKSVSKADIANANRFVEEKLDGSFFRVRLDRTTELEKAYLRAMAQLGPAEHAAGDVAVLLGRTSQQCGPTRSQLVDKGLLYTPSHGNAAFTVPHFDKFMLRAVPELKVPTIKARRGRNS